MAHQTKTEKSFEEAFDKIALSTWNRERTDNELRSFVRQHDDQLVNIEL